MLPPIVLLVLDGWGIAPPGPGNAISLAKITHIPRLWASYPRSQLTASGMGVGLPDGEDGNTETGHINIGAGRVVYQDLPRINMAIKDGTFYNNIAFTSAVKHAKDHGSNLHVMGLLSDSGVHADRSHLYALLETIKRQGLERNVYLHLFTDGRDSPPKAGHQFLEEVETYLKKLGVGKVATIMGRYYGMDRDRRWERTKAAYEALVSDVGNHAVSGSQAIEACYEKGITDEFIDPTILLDENAKPYPRINDNDAVIFYNFRIDRPRQITRAFVLPTFEEGELPQSFDPYAVNYYHKHAPETDSRNKPFKRSKVIQNLFFVTMTEYERNLPVMIGYPPEPVKLPLGRVFSDLGLRQLRMSETEKERFVTYYFNGMREDPYPGEDRLIIPSVKVPTYDLQPEMSALEITNKLIDRLSLGIYSLVVVNFANADMVGHTGNIKAAVTACETVDLCVGKIVSKVMTLGGTVAFTADHGNVEEMLGANGEMDTEHSTYPVPFVIVDKQFMGYPLRLPAGKLSDVAPTLLALRGLSIPSEMTGKNLLANTIVSRR